LRGRTGHVPQIAASPEAPPPGGVSGLDRRGFLRRFIRLAGPVFASDEKWMVRLLALGVIALSLSQIAVQIRLNLWNAEFFNALEARNWLAFIETMWIFALLASASMGIAVYQVYLKQLLQLRWRRWLTARLVDGWLENGHHYQVNFIGAGVENPDQRIAENAHFATDMAVDFTLGILNALLTLVSFLGILWTLSGVLHFAVFSTTVEVPGFMVGAALLYASIGTSITYYVGRPIITANIRQNKSEADYRFALMRLRENSEGVALIRGEDDERKGLAGFFAQVYAATKYLMQTQRRLMWLTSAYGMVGMVYPTLVASPLYFAGTMTLGGLMQTGAAFGQVQSGLNWFVDNFPRLAEWRSHVERVLEFEAVLRTRAEAALESGEAASIAVVEALPGDSAGEFLAFNDLQIAHADGSLVIGETNTTIRKGEKVLIVGQSGSGKSTLFRAIAGLWPWGTGTIQVPPRSTMMFMPQRPYLPLGTLRAALAYPAAERHFDKPALKRVLKRCNLEYLVERLDEQHRWDRVLSGGELQRVAFARLLLHKPGWVFMDEATAALDDHSQASMMKLFDHELAGSTLVSIAHRAGLDAFHDRTLGLVKATGGARLVAKRHRAARRKTPALHKRLLRKLVPKPG
jgi:vitamin B12/bleomycin/antimicrobial peptide transport system ATP-binding/permease protein